MDYEVVVSDIKTTDLDAIEDGLSGADATVRTVRADTVADIIEASRGANALISAVGVPITAELFEVVDSLEVIGRAGIGLDSVDVEAAVSNGVTVLNVPTYCIEEVSTHALALLLACVRKLPRLSSSVVDGDWDWSIARPIHRLRGRTLGLAAFGRIPRRLAAKITGFDLNLVAYDPHVEVDEMAEHGVEKVGFDELLSRSHLLSVHMPLYDATRNAFDGDAFARMRDGCVFVNTARGGLVEETVLLDALANGPVAAAGLDVLTEEPPDDSPLFDRDDIVVTPHVGWYSEESKAEVHRSVAADVRRALVGERPEGLVDPSVRWV